MASSDTDSDPEPVVAADTVSSLTAFAHLSGTRQPDPGSQSTISWAVDTLATLDFRQIRQDAALHGLIQHCASTILALFDTLLQQGPATDNSCGFVSHIASILKPSFLHLLFQYRRLFRVIAARDFTPNSAPLAIVCWVDVILAKLGDVVALVAAGLDGDHFNQSLPKSLKAQREEDNLRAAIQLPDNWDMLSSMLLSEHASAAAKRLSLRLLFGRYILRPALSGQASAVDDTIHQLVSTSSEFVRRSAARVDELRSASEPGLRHLLYQERLTVAMAISLFAAADIAQDLASHPECWTAFRPQTMAAAMKLLRFVLSEGGHTTQTNALNPPDHLDAPTSVIVRWGVVPQWTWNTWLEYSSLYADTIMYLTTTYIQHHSAGPGVPLEASDLTPNNGKSGDQAAVINVMIDLIFRSTSVLSAGAHSKQLSAGMINVIHEVCRLMSQWMYRNSCGIQEARECCKALIVLFGCSCQNEQHSALNELVIECLALMRGKCIGEAWKAVAEDSDLNFVEALGHGFVQIKTALSGEDLPKSTEIWAGQLMQFLAVVMSKRVQPLELDAFVDFMEAVGERIFERPLKDREFLCETWLQCLASANLSGFDLPLGRGNVVDDEGIWCVGMRGGDVNLFLASALSLYIVSAGVGVEPLTYLEGLERLLDVVLLICSRHCSPEEEPLALVVLPMICDAVAHLLEHKDHATAAYSETNTRISALCNVLRSVGSECDGYGALLSRRVSSTARKVLCLGTETVERKEEHELVFCRVEGVWPGRLLCIKVA